MTLRESWLQLEAAVDDCPAAPVKLNLPYIEIEHDYLRWKVGSTMSEPATQTCSNIRYELRTIIQSIGTLVLPISHAQR